jgi:hypothetical protein
MEENWLVILTFTYPHEAHMAKVYLESEGIETQIRDELTAQVNNFYSNAIGGVKLLVKESDLADGVELLKKGGFIAESDNRGDKIEIVNVRKGFVKDVCPFCKSGNISIKRVPNILMVIILFVFMIPFPVFKKSYKCFDCGKEWKYLKVQD